MTENVPDEPPVLGPRFSTPGGYHWWAVQLRNEDADDDSTLFDLIAAKDREIAELKSLVRGVWVESHDPDGWWDWIMLAKERALRAIEAKA